MKQTHEVKNVKPDIKTLKPSDALFRPNNDPQKMYHQDRLKVKLGTDCSVNILVST